MSNSLDRVDKSMLSVGPYIKAELSETSINFTDTANNVVSIDIATFLVALAAQVAALINSEVPSLLNSLSTINPVAGSEKDGDLRSSQGNVYIRVTGVWQQIYPSEYVVN